MTLLLTVFATIITTVIWYKALPDDTYHVRMLMVMFWGASLMWLVDAVFEYAELQEAYFTPAAADMLNDAFLGMSVIALALVAWVIRLLVSDPRNVLGRSLQKEIEQSAVKKSS
jgi:hypothetical protein